MPTRSALHGVLLAGLLAACWRRGPAIDCSSGGRCAPAVDHALSAPEAALGLPDLRRRSLPPEVRIWRIEWGDGSGTLTRFRDSGATVERYAWWAVAAPRGPDEPRCVGPQAVTRKGGVVLACRLADPQQPYAGNALHTFEAHGLRVHPGGTLPASRYATPTCPRTLCVEPAVLVVEVRDSARYRTYGYTVSLPGGSASDPVWLMSLLLSNPPFS